jgi:CTP synthase
MAGRFGTTGRKRDENSDLGGTMRLGGQRLQTWRRHAGARDLRARHEIVERHRHRYEVNNTLLGELEESGLVVAGRAPGTGSVRSDRAAERRANRGFVGCQFHPEFTSSPRSGHPLFTSFVQAAIACKGKA